MKPPKIICAALRSRESGILLLGPRHFDATMANTIDLLDTSGAVPSSVWKTAEQGFIDQYGVFYDRTQALKVALEGYLISPENAIGKTELYSEDLY